MNQHQHQRTKELFSSSSWPVLVWTTFFVMAGVQLLWFAFGAYLAGLYIIILDPIFLLAFGFVCALAIGQERAQRGVGLSMRGLMVLVVFLASLIFVLTRYQTGSGIVSDVNLVVTIRDADSGRPVDGAIVTALDGRTKLASTATGERGRAALHYELCTFTLHSWLLSRRTIEPDTITIEVRAESYFPQRRVLSHSTEYRMHLVSDSFRRPQKQLYIHVIMELAKET